MILAPDILADKLSERSVTTREKYLLVLFALGGEGQTSAIRSCALDNGLRTARGANVSRIMAGLEASGAVSKHGSSWAVRTKGKKKIAELLGATDVSISDLLSGVPKEEAPVLVELRKSLETLKSPEVVTFLDEVVSCLESKSLRAAIIMSWVGAMYHLQVAALSKKPIQIHSASISRLSTPKRKYKGLKSMTDFEEIKESDQLQIFQDAGLIGKTLKNQLVEKLNLRNACGHPNEIVVTEPVAHAHVDFLIHNVFAR